MNLISLFNQLLSITVLSFWSLLASILPLPATSIQRPVSRITTPATQLTASPSALVTMPEAPAELITTTPVPWGTTEKIGEHLYRVYVANDPTMGTPAEILSALNSYRRSHNAGELFSDDKLCILAQMRARQQEALGDLDGHQGLIDYMENENRWTELNITSIGENASYGYVLSGVHLIEWVFDSDLEHRANQLDPKWNLACAGVSGVTVDIIFGRR